MTKRTEETLRHAKELIPSIILKYGSKTPTSKTSIEFQIMEAMLIADTFYEMRKEYQVSPEQSIKHINEMIHA